MTLKDLLSCYYDIYHTVVITVEQYSVRNNQFISFLLLPECFVKDVNDVFSNDDLNLRVTLFMVQENYLYVTAQKFIDA